MTMFEFAVTYAICWWLVLFMVLPHKAEAAAVVQSGHVPSAPSNPRLRQKFKRTTILALIPTALLYLIISEAKAADTIYHAGTGNGCTNYVPSGDIEAKDGYSTGGKKVKSANLEGKNSYVPESFDMPLRIPGENYIKSDPTDPRDPSDSFISAGKVSVSRDGTTTINGTTVTPQDSADCSKSATKP